MVVVGERERVCACVWLKLRKNRKKEDYSKTILLCILREGGDRDGHELKLKESEVRD